MGNCYKVGPLKISFFPYAKTFRLIHTHVLVPEKFTGDVGHGRDLVLRVLREGSSNIACERRRSANGFSFIAHDQSSMTATMGGSLELKGSVTMVVEVPAKATIVLKRDCAAVATVVGRNLTYEAKDPALTASRPITGCWFGPPVDLLEPHLLEAVK